MPLKVREGVAPYSPASLRADKPPRLFADSASREQLTREMIRYLRGETGGRSMLLAGHRGAGKTTLALQAVMSAQEACAAHGQRPLLVKLEAPTLLMADPNSSASTDPAEQEMTTLLRRVTVALSQAVVDETRHAFLHLAATAPTGAHPGRRELAELAARLHIDLEGAPSLASMRDLWYRAGLTGERGLFGRGTPGHGYAEVLALWHTIEAWQVAGGTVDRSLGENRSASRGASVDWNVVTNGRQLLNPLLGLLSGGLVGVSLLDEGGVLAASLGTLSALLTTTTLNFTTKRLIDASETAMITYKPDTSVFSLSRMLPRLVRILRDIGLAPVFVVDELDKVPDLWDTMERLIRQLKYLVTEDAFFCFLTDRSYFETLRDQIGVRAYSEAQTWFTDRIFVVYRPTELHAHLLMSLEIVDSAPGSEARAADERDRELLSYALLCRARIHVQELQRLLRELQDKDGRLARGTEDRLKIWRMEAIYQVAVDALLGDVLVTGWIDRDPPQVQLVYDALYYVLDRWHSGDVKMELSTSAFREWMRQRSAPAEGAPNAEPAAESLSEADRVLLFDLAVGVATALCEPGGIRSERALPAAVSLALSSGTSPLMREACDDSNFRYRWRVDAHGRSLPSGDGLQSSVERSLRWLNAVDRELLPTYGLDLAGLSARSGLLPASMDWPAVSAAMDRQRDGAPVSLGSRTDAERVRRAGAALIEALPSLVELLASALLLSGLERGLADVDRMQEGLADLGVLFAGPRTDLAALVAMTDRLGSMRQIPPETTGALRALAQDDPRAWVVALKQGLALLLPAATDPEPIFAATRQDAWKAMLRRSISLLDGSVDSFPYETADVISHATDCFDPVLRGASTLRPGPLLRWSRVYARAVGLSEMRTPDELVPAWAGVPVAVRLGLLPWAHELCEVLAADPVEDSDLPRELLGRWRRALRRRIELLPPGRRTALVLTTGDPASVERWECPPDLGALSLDDESIRALRRGEGGQPSLRRARMASHVIIVVGDGRAQDVGALVGLSDAAILSSLVGPELLPYLRGRPLLVLLEPLPMKAMRAAGQPRANMLPATATLAEAMALFGDSVDLPLPEPVEERGPSTAGSPGASGAEGP